MAYKIVITTDNPNALLRDLGRIKGYQVADEVKLKNLDTEQIEQFNLQETRRHPFIKAMVATGIALLSGAVTLLALVASMVVAFVFLYGLVGVFGRYDYNSLRFIAVAVIVLLGYGLLWMYRSRKVAQKDYVERFEPEEPIYGQTI